MGGSHHLTRCCPTCPASWHGPLSAEYQILREYNEHRAECQPIEVVAPVPAKVG